LSRKVHPLIYKPCGQKQSRNMTTLIIAEKPSVAQKIASAIGDAQKKAKSGVP